MRKSFSQLFEMPILMPRALRAITPLYTRLLAFSSIDTHEPSPLSSPFHIAFRGSALKHRVAARAAHVAPGWPRLIRPFPVTVMGFSRFSFFGVGPAGVDFSELILLFLLTRLILYMMRFRLLHWLSEAARHAPLFSPLSLHGVTSLSLKSSIWFALDYNIRLMALLPDCWYRFTAGRWRACGRYYDEPPAPLAGAYRFDMVLLMLFSPGAARFAGHFSIL